MIYATATDLVARYGADILAPAGGRDPDATLDAAAVDLALADASNEIDLYLVRAGLIPPTASPARWLVLTACELAVSRLPESIGQSPERAKERYDQAIARLKLLLSGDDVPLTDDGGSGMPLPSAGDAVPAVMAASAPKLFSRREVRR